MAKIKVRIQATQRVFYDQICEMEEKDYRRYLAMCRRAMGDQEISEAFVDWINTHDISYAHDVEDLELSRPKAKRRA